MSRKGGWVFDRRNKCIVFEEEKGWSCEYFRFFGGKCLLYLRRKRVGVESMLGFWRGSVLYLGEKRLELRACWEMSLVF